MQMDASCGPWLMGYRGVMWDWRYHADELFIEAGCGLVQIETSVIGRECEIGRGCVVRDSYIGDGVTLHEGAMVVGALLLAGAVIHAGAKLLPGCIVSHKVR
jgi:NDP-sugar pyrophosphorylase family protein